MTNKIIFAFIGCRKIFSARKCLLLEGWLL